MLCIDFGSGYNPQIGFKTCDVNVGCDYNSIGEVEDNSVDYLRARNVLHHIEDVDSLIKEFKRVLKKDAKVIILDCRKDFFKINVLLDTIWYRSVNKRDDIFIRQSYLNYVDIFINNGFKLIIDMNIKEKELKIFKYQEE